MGTTTNKLLIILLVTFSSFLCNHATKLDNNTSTISTRHDDDDGRRVLAGYSLLFSGARALFKNVVGPPLKKLEGLFKTLDRFNKVVEVTEYTIDFGKKINFTQDNAIDYLNCQCECPNLNASGSCGDEANYTNCNQQQQYCTSFQANPKPLRCLVCHFIPQAPASFPTPRLGNDDHPSHAPSLSHTLFMLICAAIFAMHSLV